MHRLFVALRPPPAIRAALARVQHGVGGARWQDDEQLHLTLRFVGEVERPLAEDIAIALGQVGAPAPRVAIAGVGAFERQGRIDALWAGIAPAEPLARLHRKVDQALVRCGLAPDRRAYLPHVTLARVSRGSAAAAAPAIARWRADHAALATPCFALDAMILFESRLGRDGARYDAIARYPLDRERQAPGDQPG